MNREWEIDPGLGGEERQALSRLADRLEHERPLPSPAFHGELRRLLIVPRRSATRARRYRALAVSYAGLGFLCLAVAAVGLAGTGPFAA
jgi:hypothetical protein